MVDERQTPEDELEPELTDTPEGEPVETPDVEDRPDQPAPGVIAQAEYTRATQLNAAIRNKLGLPKGASQAEVMQAWEAHEAELARTARGTDDDEEEVEVDPRIAAAEQRAYEAELRVARATYGEEFADGAIETINVLRTSNDLEEVFGALALFAEQYGLSKAPADAAPAADDGEAGPAGNIDMSEGDRATASDSTPPPGRRESGVVSALRGLLSQAGASGPPR